MVEISLIDPAHPHAQHCLHEHLSALNRRFTTGFDPALSTSAAEHEMRPRPSESYLLALAGVMAHVSRKLFVVLILALASACGPASAAARPTTAASTVRSTGVPPATSPSSPVSTALEGVLMLTSSGQLGGTTSTRYSLYVVTPDGKVLRSATAGIQSIGWHLPRFSVAGRSVYFLDGDTNLKVLREDGSVADIGKLPGGPADRVIFAVSPDEKQIAYSVIHYSSGDTTTTSLRVGLLSTLGAGEIFSGAPIEFPIGWLAGRLVIAITPYASIQNNGEVNPYFASAYHVVDPITANRVYSTPATCTPQGPVNASGTICQQGSGSVLAFAWNGANRVLSPVGYAPPVVLNPDGQTAAATVLTSAIANQIALLSTGKVSPSAAAGTPAGWFDANHLLFITGPCCQALASAAVLDVRSNTVTSVDSGLAGTADPFAPFFVPIPNNLS